MLPIITTTELSLPHALPFRNFKRLKIKNLHRYTQTLFRSSQEGRDLIMTMKLVWITEILKLYITFLRQHHFSNNHEINV